MFSCVAHHATHPLMPYICHSASLIYNIMACYIWAIKLNSFKQDLAVFWYKRNGRQMRYIGILFVSRSLYYWNTIYPMTVAASMCLSLTFSNWIGQWWSHVTFAWEFNLSLSMIKRFQVNKAVLSGIPNWSSHLPAIVGINIPIPSKSCQDIIYSKVRKYTII